MPYCNNLASLDKLQKIVLARCDEWFSKYSSAEAVYVFGSVARGDYGPESDVDIFVKIRVSDHEAIADFTQMHGEIDEFKINLMWEVSRSISLHGMVPTQPDSAWPAIEKGSAAPTASIGKAFLIPTSRYTG